MSMSTEAPKIIIHYTPPILEWHDITMEPFRIQKGLEVQLISQLDLREKNAIWLNKEDHEEFFGEDTSNSTRYVQIAGQVFRAGIAKLNPGHIGMTDFELESVGEGVYPSASNHRVSVSPFSNENNKTYSIDKLEIQIEDEKDQFQEYHQRILRLDTIEKRIREILKHEKITRDKKLIFSFPGGPIKVSIKAIYPWLGYHGSSGNLVGEIKDDTELEIVPHLSPHVVLVDEVFKNGLKQMDFHVSITKRSDKANQDTLPLPISQLDIQEQIRKKHENVIISPGAQLIIHHASGWDITVKFKKGHLSEKEVKAGDYEKGYTLKDHTPIQLTHHRDILLTEGKAEPATEITFKIADITGYQTTEIDHTKQRWVNLEELKETLKTIKRPFAAKEKFEVSLSSGRFLIEVIKAKGKQEKYREKDIEPLWSIDAETNMEIVAEKELIVNLLRDGNVHPIKRATIHVQSERIPDEGLIIAMERLKEIATNQAPKRIVQNHTFSVETQDGNRLEFRVIRTLFDDSVGTIKEVSAFGRITKDTSIDFSTNAQENLILVDAVHSKNIKAMRFSIEVTQQQDVGSHTRLPIILGREELIRLIREELVKHDFITVGHKFFFPLDNGWNIGVTFNKGILEKGGVGSENTRVKTSELIQEGYQISKDTEVQFVGGGEWISLTSGDPVLAKQMHVQITEIDEDFTTQDTPLEIGAWINTEELKAELISLNKPLAHKEKIPVELESGRYILEFKTAKPIDPKAKRPKKPKETTWHISQETKLDVTVDRGIDLFPIIDGKIHPLSRIEFIAFPEFNGEHFTVEEEELREALKEVHPDRFIKGQVLSLETTSNHTVLVEVKRLTLENKNSNLNLDKIFTQITDQTEIIFHGKEKINMAVKSEPKVLQVDDPIKYLEELGMAGIDKEFEQLYRILYSRSGHLKEEARRRGTKPIKGVLLHGPPGTGKTTLVRLAGEMLGCSGERLKVLNSTEVLSKWFGESEENVRKVFAPAEEAQKKYGDQSPLYIIAIDEFEVIAAQRGESINKTRDSIANQLLGAMDGYNKLNNLLIIGVTNRKDIIDPAFLRHGRLGVHIEIGLPDRPARRKIFGVHTKELINEGLLHESVNLDSLADQTEGLPGANIVGIIEQASLFSLERLSKLKCSKEELRMHPDGMVIMDDFENALKELHSEKEIPESVWQIYS